jgi:DNA-binding helix-hairpin-helix protein with protein kinase domain
MKHLNIAKCQFVREARLIFANEPSSAGEKLKGAEFAKRVHAEAVAREKKGDTEATVETSEDALKTLQEIEALKQGEITQTTEEWTALAQEIGSKLTLDKKLTPDEAQALKALTDTRWKEEVAEETPATTTETPATTAEKAPEQTGTLEERIKEAADFKKEKVVVPILVRALETAGKK